MLSDMGNVLLIANPTAQNGKAAEAAREAEALLWERLGEGVLDVAFTASAGHAVDLAHEAAGKYGVVLALGGDGIIHETANGLMRIDAADRPVFGIIPVGSGNDYARTLGMSTKVEKVVDQLVSAEPRLHDVGVCNGEYFVETLSFGLDAAIAADTTERRKRTGRTGTIMYLEAGIDQLLHHLDRYSYQALFRGARPCPTGGARSAASFRALAATAGGVVGSGAAVGEAVAGGVAAGEVESAELQPLDIIARGDMFMFGVQIGQTYGGGFHVCPDAKPDDGLFDICIAHPPLPWPVALVAFLMAKEGRHTSFKQLEFLRAEGMHIEFDTPPVVQLDGEKVEGAVFDVCILPRELRVLVPRS